MPTLPIQVLNDMKQITGRSIPSMKEINASKKTLTAVSFFSGCGGSSTGYKMAGYKVLYANEFIPIAAETYKANHTGTYVESKDIRQVKPEDILKICKLKKGELDLLDGSPPCRSFSTAGKRDEGWNTEALYSEGVYQRTDDLFNEYVRMIKGLKPKVFVAENVAGLVEGVARGYFIEIFNALKDCGYQVEARILNASEFGVPQARRRLIFVGVRNDLKLKPVYPSPTVDYLTVRDVLPNILYLKSKRKGILTYIPSDVPSPTITASDKVNSETAGFSCGGWVEDNKGIRRKYTIQELKKVFSFPADFVLPGKFEQQWERLGRSVPPLLMYNVAKAIREGIFEQTGKPAPKAAAGKVTTPEKAKTATEKKPVSKKPVSKAAAKPATKSVSVARPATRITKTKVTK